MNKPTYGPTITKLQIEQLNRFIFEPAAVALDRAGIPLQTKNKNIKYYQVGKEKM